MKSILLSFAAALCLFTVVPAQADDCCQSTTATIKQRLRDIDIAVDLKSYELIRTEQAKAQLQVTLLQADISADSDKEPELRLALKRLQHLNAAADHIRAKLNELGQELAVASK